MSQEMDPKTQKLREIGSAIREQRERLGLSIEDVREKTLIRRKYLLAVEEGDDSAAPGQVYFKGFLKSYASFVGLDGQALAKEYQDLLDQAQAEKEAPKAQRAPRAATRRPAPSVRRQTESQSRTRRPAKRRSSPALLLFTLLFVLALGAYYLASSGVLAGIWQPKEPVEQEPPGNGPEIPNVPEDPGTTEPHEPAAPAIARTDPNSETSVWECQNVERLELTVKALTAEDSYCWIRVKSDGKTVYEGTMVPGEKLEFTGSEEIVVRAGKPWAITLSLNGEDLGVGGELGPVKDLVFRIPAGTQ